ncbi:hypothetical protein WH91_05720 [Devosia psychrophila]|nr:hypothetical protein WH91_05720 [Devosia psychrophila]
MFNFYGDDETGATEIAGALSSAFLSTGATSLNASAVRGMLGGIGTTGKYATASNVLIENLAVGGTTVDGNAIGVSPSIAWWYPDTDTPGQLLLTAVSRINQVLSAIQAAGNEVVLSVVWAQGENDAKLIMDGKSDAGTYKEATTELFARLTSSVNAPFDIYLQEVGVTNYTGGDARWNGGQDIIRAAQREIATQSDRIHIAAVTEDLPLRDHVHISEESYEVVGRRLASYIAFDKGFTTEIPSPRPFVDPDLGPLVDQPPLARADVIEASLNQLTVSSNVLTNDYDPDRDAISVISADGHPVASGSATVVQGLYGTLTINANGSYAYVVNTAIVGPDSFANGNLHETFDYVIRDQDNFTAKTSLTVSIVGVPEINTFVGTANKDSLSGTVENDVLLGLGGDDTLKGREGDDRIYGGTGIDTVEGNAGNDVIIGGDGADKLKGSGGNDTFVIRSAAEAGDAIADWGSSETLDLTGLYAGSGATTASALIANGQLEIRTVAGGSQVWATINGSAFLVAAITGPVITATQIKVNNATHYVEDGYAAPGYGGPTTLPTHPPVANPDGNQATSSTPTVIGNVLENDSDPEEDALAVISVDGLTVAAGSATIVAGLYGTLTINRDGSYSYVVDPSKVQPGQGSLHDIFTYGIEDTESLHDTAALTITVVVPDIARQPPTAVDDVNAASPANATVSGNVVTNDTDPTNEVLRIVSVDGHAVVTGSPTVIVGLFGTLTINVNGSYSYVVDPAKVPAGQGSLPDVFHYTVADPGNLQDAGTLTVTVRAPALQPPVAVDDANAASLSNATVSGNVVTNDTDPNHDVLRIVSVDGHAVAAGSPTVVVGSYGALTIHSDGTYSYVVDLAKVPAGQGNLPDIFNYTVADPGNLQDAGKLTVTVSAPALQPPVAVDDVNAAPLDIATVSGNVIANDTDSNHDVLSIVSVSGHAVASGSPTIVIGSYGTLTINTDGSYSYTVDPAKVPAGQGSLPEVFTYTVSDPSHLQDSGALTVTVTSPPISGGDTNTDGNMPPAGAIVGTDAINRITGGAGADRIHGLGGADTLKGGLGNDIIFGGSGADILEGNDGADILFGGTGNDSIKGGAGADTLVFSDGDGSDTVLQLRRDDTIILENSLFHTKADALAALVAGPQAGTFVLNYSPVDSITFTDTTLVELTGAVWVFGSADIV